MAGQIVNQAQTDTPGTPVTVLNVNTTSQATTGTSEEVLATYTLPANTLSANGKAIRVRAWLSHAANTNASTMRIRFGGVGGTQISAMSSAASGDAIVLEAIVIRTGAATQIANGHSRTHGGSSAVYNSAPTQTLSGGVALVVTGLTAVSAGDVTFLGMLVEALN